MSFIKREIQDAIRDRLKAASTLDAIKVFVRGYAVKPMTNDQYPFCEIIIGDEDGVEDYSGGVLERSYNGLITFSTQSIGDLFSVSDREANVDSYDAVEELIVYASIELQKETHQSLGDLTTTLTVGTTTITDVVKRFYLGGPITYGIDDRGNNYENYGTIPFIVETERTIITA